MSYELGEVYKLDPELRISHPDYKSVEAGKGELLRKTPCASGGICPSKVCDHMVLSLAHVSHPLCGYGKADNPVFIRAD